MCCRCVLLSQSDAFVYVPSSGSAAVPSGGTAAVARGGGAGSQAAAERRAALATDPAS